MLVRRRPTRSWGTPHVYFRGRSEIPTGGRLSLAREFEAIRAVSMDAIEQSQWKTLQNLRDGTNGIIAYCAC